MGLEVRRRRWSWVRDVCTIVKNSVVDGIAKEIDSVRHSIAASRIAVIGACRWVSVRRLVPLVHTWQKIFRQLIAVEIRRIVTRIIRRP